jgi:hypothetical protein
MSYIISIAWQLVNNLSSRSTGNVSLHHYIQNAQIPVQYVLEILPPEAQETGG